MDIIERHQTAAAILHQFGWDAVYGYEFSWYDFDGGKTTVAATGFRTKEEAIESKIKSALECGYTPPKWWHWWRWGEAPL